MSKLAKMKSMYGLGQGSQPTSVNQNQGNIPTDLTGWAPEGEVFPYGLWSGTRLKEKKSDFSL